MTQAELVLDALRAELRRQGVGVKTGDVARRLGRSTRWAYKRLRRLRDMGRVEQNGCTWWVEGFAED